MTNGDWGDASGRTDLDPEIALGRGSRPLTIELAAALVGVAGQRIPPLPEPRGSILEQESRNATFPQWRLRSKFDHYGDDAVLSDV